MASGAQGRASGPLPSSPPRIADQRFEKACYFVFGDFNFRLDSKSVVEVGPAGGSPARGRAVCTAEPGPRWARPRPPARRSARGRNAP